MWQLTNLTSFSLSLTSFLNAALSSLNTNHNTTTLHCSTLYCSTLYCSTLHFSTLLYTVQNKTDTTENKLREAFGEFGTVTDVFLPMERNTQRPRGFVSLAGRAAAEAAIAKMDQAQLDNRTIRVNESRPRGEQGGDGPGGRGGAGPGGRGGFNSGGSPSSGSITATAASNQWQWRHHGRDSSGIMAVAASRQIQPPCYHFQH